MKKKNLIRTIVIAVVIVLLIACVTVLSILFRKDVRGLNYFDRSKVAASAGGQTVTVGEYAIAFDNAVNYYATYLGTTYADEDIPELQKDVVEDMLQQKLAVAKLDELGLSLTAEELASCKSEAEEQLKTLEEQIGKQMASSANFSNASLQAQINEYFTRQLGMSKAQYKTFVENQQKASLAMEKLEDYYKAETSEYTEDELLAYYDNYVTENFADVYTPGAYSMQMYMYMVGYYQIPYLYVPDSFVYGDVLTYTADTEENALAMQARFENGENFDALAADGTLVSLHDSLDAPYAIGESDYGYLASDSELYATLSGLEIGGETSLLVPNTTTADDGTTSTTSYTLYILKRMEGNICEGGAAFGIVDIDHYAGVREVIGSSLEQQKLQDIFHGWMTDEQISDAVYAYKGSLA